MESLMPQRSSVSPAGPFCRQDSTSVSSPPLPEEDRMDPSFVATLLRFLVAVDLWASRQLAVCAGEDSAWASARPLMKLLEISGHGIPWLVGTVSGLYVSGSPAVREVLINLFFALLLDLTLVGVLKGLVKRRRPSYNKMDMFATLSVDKYAFPSGHATRASMVCSLVLRHLNLPALLQVLVVLWALVVGISRVMLGRHHVTDVIFGLAMGYMQYRVVEYFWFSPPNAPALFRAGSKSQCLLHHR